MRPSEGPEKAREAQGRAQERHKKGHRRHHKSHRKAERRAKGGTEKAQRRQMTRAGSKSLWLRGSGSVGHRRVWNTSMLIAKCNGNKTVGSKGGYLRYAARASWNTQLTQKMIIVRHRDWTAPVLLSRCMSALHSSAPAAQCTRDLMIQKNGAKRTRWRLQGQTSYKGRIVAEPTSTLPVFEN